MAKSNVGRVGIWRRWNDLSPELATEVERLGYGTIWAGGSPSGDLDFAERLLAASDRVMVATGIVNMWATPAEESAASYHRLNSLHDGRFLLGVGIGHREAVQEYRNPYEKIVDYLDRLDAQEVPVSGRVLAALGPKVLRLSGERAAGAHPYLTTPEHTRRARAELGEWPLLAPEQKVIVDTDAGRARALARDALSGTYLKMRNYAANLKRLGYTDADFAGGGSDALIDALVAHGEPAEVAERLNEHLDAGADHVAVQVLTGSGQDPLPALRAVAEAMNLA